MSPAAQLSLKIWVRPALARPRNSTLPPVALMKVKPLKLISFERPMTRAVLMVMWPVSVMGVEPPRAVLSSERLDAVLMDILRWTPGGDIQCYHIRVCVGQGRRRKKE